MLNFLSPLFLSIVEATYVTAPALSMRVPSRLPAIDEPTAMIFLGIALLFLVSFIRRMRVDLVSSSKPHFKGPSIQPGRDRRRVRPVQENI